MECVTAARVVYSNPNIAFNCVCKPSPGLAIILTTNRIPTETLSYLPGTSKLAEKPLC